MKIPLFILFLFAVPAWSQENQVETNYTKVVYRCPCDDLEYNTPGKCEFCNLPLYATYSSLKNTNTNKLNKTVAILVFPGVEVIDFAGPYEVFWAAGAKVITVAESPDVLEAGTSLKITPDYTFDTMPQADIIVLPGGNVDRNNPNILRWIKDQNKLTEKILSVCNGAFFLSSADLLDGLTATTFFPAIPSLRSNTPKAKVVDDQRYVNNGHIITSAGLSSGIDAALFVVSEYMGVGGAQQLATLLEYKWNYDNGFVRGQLADKHLIRTLDVFSAFRHRILLYAGNEREWNVNLTLDTELKPLQIMKLAEAQMNNVNQWKPIMASDRSGQWTFMNGQQEWRCSITIDGKSENTKQVVLTVSRK